ncbi:MAG: hypothetical protein QOC92_1118, partial [Acidimicrobiaceae bacterium]
MNTRTRQVAAAALVVAVVLAVIIFRGRGNGTTKTVAPSTTSSASSANTTNPASPDSVPGLTQIATVEAPTAMAARPGDTSLYVAEQVGRVRRLRRASNNFTVDDAPVIDLSSDVRSGGEQGLLGIAFSADGARLYLAFTNRGADQQVDEVALDGDRVVDGSRRTLLVVPDFAPNHNGGDLVLGPDGFLYYTMGDGGGAGDPQKSGQNPNDLLGDVLRIDPT